MNLESTLEEIRNILIENDLKIACAESCTGGLVSSYLTDLPGSGEYVEQNFVTYSNEAKTRFLGVKKETLDAYGAVSKDVAYQMASGLLNYADCALATTGILGPTGGSEEKPIGLCYMGFGLKCGSCDSIIKVIRFQSEIAKNIKFVKIAKGDVQIKRVEIKKDIAKNSLFNLIGFLRENIATCKET